MQVAVIF